MKEIACLYEVTLEYRNGNPYGVMPWIIARSIPGAMRKAKSWARKETTDNLHVVSVNRKGTIEVL